MAPQFTEAKGTTVPLGTTSSTPSSSSSSGVLRSTPAPFASLSFGLSLQQQPGRRTWAAPFASVSAAHSSGGVPRLFGAPQQEAATGIAYPAELCVLTKGHCPKLAGLGVRAKRILGLKNINVYSVGLYVDGPAAKKALHKYKGASADSLLANKAAWEDLVASSSFERSLRLVISFGSLKRSQFVSALEERLKPALSKAKEPASTMAAFERLFDNVAFKKGTEIAFATHHRGQLVTRIDGKQVGSITSPALVKALFDIYVGPDPVSTDAKASIGRGLAALLNE